MHKLNYIGKTCKQDTRKSRLKTKSITKGQFLLIRVKSHRDFLTGRSLCAGHLSYSLPDILVLHVLGAAGPRREPVGAALTAPLLSASTWAWPVENTSRRLRGGGPVGRGA